jgi:hypothetical protein
MCNGSLDRFRDIRSKSGKLRFFKPPLRGNWTFSPLQLHNALLIALQRAHASHVADYRIRYRMIVHRNLPGMFRCTHEVIADPEAQS